jgi:hypothetical protein
MTVGGCPVSYAGLIRDDHDHQEIVRWLWQVVLADGTRALTRAGRWSEALACTRQYNGIGDRLLDGRQILILARAAEGGHQAARAVLVASITQTAWEKAVAACLETLLLALAGQPCDAAANAMASACERPGAAPGHAVFGIRLGLASLDLTAGTSRQAATARQVIRTALGTDDAYAAWEVTRHPACMTHAATAEHTTLAAAVREAWLGHGAPPAAELDRLMHAASTSEAAMTAALSARTRARPGRVPATRF